MRFKSSKFKKKKKKNTPFVKKKKKSQMCQLSLITLFKSTVPDCSAQCSGTSRQSNRAEPPETHSGGGGGGASILSCTRFPSLHSTSSACPQPSPSSGIGRPLYDVSKPRL